MQLHLDQVRGVSLAGASNAVGQGINWTRLWIDDVLSTGQPEGEKRMHVLWGILMVVVGLFLVICGRLKSEFIIYRLMVARSRMLWGDNVHRFHQIAGAIVVVFGVIVALGYV